MNNHKKNCQKGIKMEIQGLDNIEKILFNIKKENKISFKKLVLNVVIWSAWIVVEHACFDDLSKLCCFPLFVEVQKFDQTTAIACLTCLHWQYMYTGFNAQDSVTALARNIWTCSTNCSFGFIHTEIYMITTRVLFLDKV